MPPTLCNARIMRKNIYCVQRMVLVLKKILINTQCQCLSIGLQYWQCTLYFPTFLQDSVVSKYLLKLNVIFISYEEMIPTFHFQGIRFPVFLTFQSCLSSDIIGVCFMMARSKQTLARLWNLKRLRSFSQNNHSVISFISFLWHNRHEVEMLGDFRMATIATIRQLRITVYYKCAFFMYNAVCFFFNLIKI